MYFLMDNINPVMQSRDAIPWMMKNRSKLQYFSSRFQERCVDRQKKEKKLNFCCYF